MYTDQLQRWADNAAYTAGKAYNQGRDLFYTARDKAYEAARRAQNARRQQMKQVEASPSLHDRWHELLENTGSSLSRAGSHLHSRFHHTERTLLKIGAVLLVFKCFQRRDDPVAALASDARAHIEERPVESAVIALLVGYAIGKLLR